MLRQYQEEDVSALRQAMRGGAKRCNFESSVGSGKSVVIEYLAREYSNAGKRILVLSNRSAVVDQLDGRAGHLPGVSVMTVQAADRRREELSASPVDLILIDESHMGGSAAQYARVIATSPCSHVVAFTGTPKPETFETFPCHVKGRSARWLTDNGFLAPLRYIAPSKLDLSRIAVRRGEYDEVQVLEELERRRIYADAVESYRTHGIGVPTLAFCVNVKHAQDTAAQFRQAGHACEVLTGKDGDEDVKRKIAALRDGGLVFSVDKVSAGFDLPDLRVLLSLRPTKSEQLWVQQLGRAARAAPGKTHGLVLDHVGNTLRLGTLTEERDWRAVGDRKPKTTSADGEKMSVRQCDGCLAVFEAGPAACPFCGAVLAKETRITTAEQVRLKEIEAAEIEAARRAAADRRKRLGQTIPQLRAWLPARGPGAAHRQAVNVMRGRLDKALRTGDAELESFCRDQLRKFGGGA